MSQHKKNQQSGFTLIEIMIGLVIGLILSLVIYNVLSTFEKQKRATTGSSDAQTNGAIALYNIQRDAQMAGFGLPVYGVNTSPFNCPIATAIDHDYVAGTPAINLSPIVITDGGATGSDVISIHYGDTMSGGVAVSMLAGTATNVAQVNTNIGCVVNDTALVVQEIAGVLSCNLTRVTSLQSIPDRITLASTTNVAVGSDVACLGTWNEVQYAVASISNSTQLTRTGAVALVAGVPTPNAAAVPIVPDIVNIQAQYGVSATPGSNVVTQWVDATGIWGAAITASNRNRIKAIHVAVIARNGSLENSNVTSACSSTSAANPTGLCAWQGLPVGGTITVASPAPAIDLSADANWRRYRYRVYDTIIPIRNIIWSWTTVK